MNAYWECYFRFMPGRKSILTALLLFTMEGCKEMPEVITAEVTSIASTTAVSGGKVIDDGNDEIIARGICWSSQASPTIIDNFTVDGSGIGTFTSSLLHLTPNTQYYIKAYATNSEGIAYGNPVSFTTKSYTIQDIDGNSYNVVQLGTQYWMKENLKTTRYRDGISIPLVTDNMTWTNLSTPGFCWYNNDVATFGTTYGALYNWYTINTGKLCPEGWHVPSDNEWKILEMVIGMNQTSADAAGWRGTDEGGKLKAVSPLWTGQNMGATNSSLFTALPSGNRTGTGIFESEGFFTDFWTSTFNPGTQFCWYRYLDSDHSQIYRVDGNKNYGTPVRCIKD
jgi:uncharacterized protein (TIGR02145 family)